tara:strand:- start:2163 stop:2375 length:213 start_codon:yes stop_codon:yes gene_type:complete
MKTTKKELALHSTQKLIDYANKLADQIAKGSESTVRRLSGHNSAISLICHEVQRRQLDAMKTGKFEPTFK